MARIRNIKPDYFRHEALQDLEAAHPGCYVMLTYIALWTQCDANGIFPYKPRTLKLDILPFIPFDLANTLQILHTHGFIQTFENQNNTYGYIPTFKKHQRITGKEATEGEKYPKPNQSQPGNTGETTGKHPDAQGEGRIIGKEIREREGNNPHAHEGNHEKQKNQEPTPDLPSNAATADPYSHCLAQIRQWGRASGDWAALQDYARSVNYDPDTYGPVNDEVQKFTAYWLDAKRHPDDRAAFQADPARFFQEKGRKWLLDAKNMNRPNRKNNTPQKPKYEPPPPHQRQPRTNSNATTVTHIGDTTGKIITPI